MSDDRFVIRGVVRHSCGWQSDGGAFFEGAGCPKCTDPISRDSVEKVRETLGVRTRDATEREPELEPTGEPELSIAERLEAMTVPEAAAFVSEVESLGELAEVQSAEASGKNRKGVLAAIDARADELGKGE